MSDVRPPVPFADGADHLVHLALRYIDGTIEEAELTQLESLLTADRLHRRLFVAMCLQAQLMREALEPSRLAIQNAGEPSAAELMDEVLEQQRIAAELRARAVAAGQHQAADDADRFTLLLPDEVDLTPVRHIVIPRWLVYGGMTAVAAMLLLALYPFLPGRGGQEPLIEPEPLAVQKPAPFIETPAPVAPPVPVARARISHAVDVQWGGVEPSDGWAPAGIPFKLTHGVVELSFTTGAKTTVEAPATFEVLGDGRLALRSGRLVAFAPEEAVGFTVETARARIVDLGTAFGVWAEAAAGTEVHVFQGAVAVDPGRNSTGEAGERRLLHAGEAGRVDATAQLQPIALRREDFQLSRDALVGVNLIVNGDFEADEPGVMLDAQKWTARPISGWRSDTNDVATLNYEQAAAFGFPDPSQHTTPPNRGRAYLASLTPHTLWQEIRIASLGDLIDQRRIAFELSGWLGGWQDNPDPTTVSAVFLDERKIEISRAEIGPVTVEQRAGRTGFVPLNVRGVIPAATRYVRLVIEAREDRGVVDGYVDNLAFVLSHRD